MLIYFRKRYWKKLLMVYAVGIVGFIGCTIYQGDSALLWDTLDVLTEPYIPKSQRKLSDITLNDEDFNITYDGHVFTVKYIKNEDDAYMIEIKDADGTVIPTSVNEEQSGYILEDERLEGLQFIFGADESLNIGFSILVNEKSFFIYHSEADNTYYYVNYYGRPTKMYSSDIYESKVFGLMGGFTKRSSIWEKSIPILKKTLILGSGPDTFAFMFPQYNYVTLVQDGWRKQLITKPHSLYLQTGIQTGVLSLLAFIVLNAWYILASMKLYFNKEYTTFTQQCGAAIFVAAFCFLFAGATTDSTVGVSVVYWSLLGIGIACNEAVKKNEMSEIAEIG